MDTPSNITVHILFCTIQQGHGHSLFIPELALTMVVTVGGVIITLLAILCIVTNTAMDPSYRSILLSYSIANVLGTAMLAYDTISLICNHSAERLSFVITISIMLSLSHLFILTMDQVSSSHCVLPCSNNRYEYFQNILFRRIVMFIMI